MSTLQEFAARQKAKARRRLVRPGANPSTRGPAEAVTAREVLMGPAQPIGPRAPREASTVAAPLGAQRSAAAFRLQTAALLIDTPLAIPGALADTATLPEPDAFAGVASAANPLRKLLEGLQLVLPTLHDHSRPAQTNPTPRPSEEREANPGLALKSRGSA